MKIHELYSMDTIDGVLTIIKREPAEWLVRLGRYAYVPDMLINPEFDIKEGVLYIKSQHHSFEKIYTTSPRDSYNFNWLPCPTRDLKENWRELVYHNVDNLVQKKAVTWTGKLYTFNLKRISETIEHLEAGYYLQKTGYTDDTKTSNFKIIK